MKNYEETFRSGRWVPPSGEQILKWMNKYLLSRSDLALIVGVEADHIRRFCNSKLKMNPNDIPFRSQHFMSYAETRMFLIYIDKIDPEVFGGGNRILGVFESFVQTLLRHNISFEEFSDRFLDGMIRDSYFHYKKKNDDAFKDKLKAGIDILERELFWYLPIGLYYVL